VTTNGDRSGLRRRRFDGSGIDPLIDPRFRARRNPSRTEGYWGKSAYFVPRRIRVRVPGFPACQRVRQSLRRAGRLASLFGLPTFFVPHRCEWTWEDVDEHHGII
jgi:hypothetical protein